jgi:hypothetical protein
MINPLTPAQYAAALGRAAREAAREEQPPGAFRRGQLMSVYSGSRHLAVELSYFEAELRSFSTAAAAAVAETAIGVPDDAVLRQFASELSGNCDPESIGGLVSELLGLLRGHRSGVFAELRVELQARLRDLCDREVQLLAEAIEGTPRP